MDWKDESVEYGKLLVAFGIFFLVVVILSWIWGEKLFQLLLQFTSWYDRFTREI